MLETRQHTANRNISDIYHKQVTSKPETTNYRQMEDIGGKGGESRLGLGFGKINSKGSIEFSFLNATLTQFGA